MKGQPVTDKPQVYRLKKAEPKRSPQDLGPIEREFVAAIGDYVDWAIAESIGAGNTSVYAYLMVESFWIEKRSSRRVNPIYWGAIAPHNPQRADKLHTPIDQGQRLRAIAAIRKELNDLPPSLHLTDHSSIEIEVFFERGNLKSAKLTRLRKA